MCWPISTATMLIDMIFLSVMQHARHAKETTTCCNTKILSEVSMVNCKGDAATQPHFLEKSQLLFLEIFRSQLQLINTSVQFQSSCMTESQNVRGWKGPLWVI